MLKRYFVGCCSVGCLVLGWQAAGFAFGEPRIVPNTSFYFDNFRHDRYPNATVVRILSVDTIVAQVEGDNRLRIIRLAGIQAADADPRFQQQAIELMQRRIQYRTVKLEGDTLLRNQDATGPVEAYVWLEGEQMNGLLVRSGLVTIRTYTHNIKYDHYLVGLQERARAERLGIWSAQ